ncbi:uncharacterized protein LOC129940928 [Eupeodes corollae]|uniref:uncharacterized protein LOC129940928 n=1 Tax=Eupeodes corollae TaxID=290404 RepID=UPI002491577A|nr:uncharacterized protein LOC129940928 [Eupeodes corollae]
MVSRHQLQRQQQKQQQQQQQQDSQDQEDNLVVNSEVNSDAEQEVESDDQDHIPYGQKMNSQVDEVIFSEQVPEGSATGAASAAAAAIEEEKAVTTVKKTGTTRVKRKRSDSLTAASTSTANHHSKKQKSSPMTTTNKKLTLTRNSTVDEILEFSTRGPSRTTGMLTALKIILILWTDDFMMTAPQTLKQLVSKCMKAKKFDLKRIIYTMQQAVLNICEDLKAQQVNLQQFSQRDFCRSLQKTVYYTMYTDEDLTVEQGDWILANYELPSQEATLPYVNTTTTCMSSTIVPTATAAAAVPLENISKPAQPDDTLGGLFPPTATRSSTGLICQSICKKTPDSLCIWSTPGESGYRVIKMDIYNFSKIANVQKNNWWKEADYRTTFITNSSVDPIDQQVTKLLTAVAHQIKKTPNIQKEEKATKSSNFFYHGQHHQ